MGKIEQNELELLKRAEKMAFWSVLGLLILSILTLIWLILEVKWGVNNNFFEVF